MTTGHNHVFGHAQDDENSGGTPAGEAHLPWYAHPNDKGRDIQAKQIADKTEQILNL
ncbi:hypothetical protein [Streptomyces niveus]|uniref:hypothetical protein n=1 Tax=Streptomyces niveus TaxID=193462 RepID=UPI00367F7E24